MSHLEGDLSDPVSGLHGDPVTVLVDHDVPDGELVDAELVPELPVVAGHALVGPARWSEHPTVQAAAAAATGFVAGAATLALMQRYSLRRVTRHVHDTLDPAGARLRGPFPAGPGQTYLVYVRAVTVRSPE